MTTGPVSTRQTSTSSHLVVPKIYYFCFFAAMSCLMPYLVLYYRQIGLSGREIGFLTGLAPLITLVAAPLWGALADATRKHKALLLVAVVGALVTVGFLSIARTMLLLAPIVVVYATFTAPIMPLVDNSVMAQLGERRDLYGRQRMWGAVGWGLMGWLAGSLIEQYGVSLSFAGFWVLMGAGLLAALRLNVSDSRIGHKFWEGLRTLATNRTWIVLLVTVYIAGIGSGVSSNFLFLYLADLDAGEGLMGASLMVGTLSEMPIFFFSSYLLRKFGARGLMIIALAAACVRMFAYAVMPAPEYVLLIHLLHGLTFSALWVAGVNYASELAPAGMGATAQGLFSGVTMGVGSASGALLGGFLYDGYGPVAMFAWVAGAVAVGLVFFVIATRMVAADAQPN